jgi:hypothetical protein
MWTLAQSSTFTVVNLLNRPGWAAIAGQNL